MTLDIEDFERLASALQPWLAQVVIVGGWAHRLSHEHPLALKPTYQPVRTRDADVAFGSRTRLHGKLNVALAQAGFREELSSEESPPIAQYRLGAADEGFYAEFLTPLSGSGVRRSGAADATLARAGIVAQKLRHLEILLVAPWTIPVGGGSSAHLPSVVDVRIANPVSFIAQKLLIHGDRKPGKRQQDILYMHDTIQLFSGSLADLNALWREEIRGTLTPAQRRTLTTRTRGVFSVVSDDIRQATRIPQDRRLVPEEVSAVCAEGLAQLFASA